ncbi:MAG: helix-turn-helix transcriptional regulator [Solirubrobacteraceae bacterium]|nr:helix-turn-helix transcriptional regulator [Patulibacter sp.]
MPPSVSPVARDAAKFLGARIKAARLERGWTVAELAERAQVGRDTIMSVERGGLRVAVGTVFDCAFLVGVPLFYDDAQRLAAEAARGQAPLLGRRARPVTDESDVDLDF